MSLAAASLIVGIAAVLFAGIWRCAGLLLRVAVAIEAVPELARAVQQLEHRTTRLEAVTGRLVDVSTSPQTAGGTAP